MRKAEEFSIVKKSYLDKKRQQGSPGFSRTTNKVPNIRSGSKARTIGGVKHVTKTAKKVQNTTAEIDDLPNEILFKLFGYLDVKSVLSCASVCKRWEKIANDNSFWKVFYTRHVYMNAKKFSANAVHEPPSPLEVEEKYWKIKLFSKSKQMRNKSFLALSKISPYTGVVDKMDKHLEKLGAKFLLSFSCKSGQIFNFIERKRQISPTSTLLQWYSLKAWPNLRNVVKIQIFSLTPFVHGSEKKLIKNGPRQRSLVFEEKIDTKIFEKKDVFSTNDEIDSYRTKSGVLVSVWKDTLVIAFVSASLHHRLLLKKCVLSNSTTIYSELHQVQPGVLDKSYGLHGYKIHLQLTNNDGTTPWDIRLHSDDCENTTSASFVSITKAKNLFSSSFNSSGLNWKTDAFNGSLKNVSFLTTTVVDINTDVFWSATSPVKFEFSSNEVVNFDQNSDKGLKIAYRDDIGNVELFFIDSGQGYSLERVTVLLNLKTVNTWFGMMH